MKQNTKSILFTLLKVIFSASIIIIIVNSLDLSEAYYTLSKANLFLILLSFLVPIIITAIITYKWDILLRTKNIKTSLWKLFNINLISHFWGLFLPSSVSIDFLRGYYLAKDGSGKMVSAAVIIIDRIFGIISLLTTAIIGLVISSKTFTTLHIYFYIFLLLIPTLILVIVLFSDKPVQILGRIKIKKYVMLISKIKKTLITFNEFNKHPFALLYTFLLSLLIQFFRIIHIFFISEAYSTNISINYYIVLVPVIMIIVMIPISVGGIGVREGGFVAFFTLVGLSAEQGAIISLTSSLVMTLVAILGGIVFLFYKNEVNRINIKNSNSL